MRFLILGLVSMLLFAINSQAQSARIVTVLKNSILKEMTRTFAQEDMPMLTHIAIENDALILQYKTINHAKSIYTLHTHHVALQDIISLEKDINILFICKNESVKINEKVYALSSHILQAEKTTYSNVFFTLLHSYSYGEKWRNRLLKAFKKAGQPIESNYWYH